MRNKNRIKVKKHEATLDPRVVSLVNELTKDYRQRMGELEKKNELLEERLNNQLVYLQNHEVVFGDLHSSFCVLSQGSMGGSLKDVVGEFGELGQRTLSDYSEVSGQEDLVTIERYEPFEGDPP